MDTMINFIFGYISFAIPLIIYNYIKGESIIKYMTISFIFLIMIVLYFYIQGWIENVNDTKVTKRKI
jgi:hypothetical protein